MVYTTRDLSGWNQAIRGIGDTLAGVLDKRGNLRRERESPNLIQDAIAQASTNPETGEQRDLSPMQLINTLLSAQGQGASPQDVMNYASTYKNIVGSRQKGIFQEEDPERIKQTLVDLGLDEKTADVHSRLYSNLSMGGKTAYGNFLIDQLQRNQVGSIGTPAVQEKEVEISSPGKREELFTEQFEFPQINPYGEGLTPKEKAKVQSELFKDNAKIEKENADKLKGLVSEERSIRQLNTINERGKLPKNLKKLLTVDLKTGESRITPSLLNADAQLFVKTINEFVRKARDSFGARVTNFELDKFLQGLPTLANTEEGRRLILEQMDVINKLNQLEYQSLENVYKNYGLRGIDQLQARSIAEKMRKPKQEELIKRFDRVVLKNDILNAKQKLPKNHSLVIYNGQVKAVRDEDIEKARKAGAEIL